MVRKKHKFLFYGDFTSLTLWLGPFHLISTLNLSLLLLMRCFPWPFQNFFLELQKTVIHGMEGKGVGGVHIPVLNGMALNEDEV